MNRMTNASNTGQPHVTRKMNYALWTVQVLVAMIFLLAGGMKEIVPIAEMTKQSPLPGWFLRSLGVAEMIGALGLILPGVLRMYQYLTPIAAVCLEIIMIGAVSITVAMQGVAPAILPFVTGIGLAFIIYGRWARTGARNNHLGRVDPATVRSI